MDFGKTKQDFLLRDLVDYKSKKSSAQNTLKRSYESLERSQASPKVKIVQFIRPFCSDGHVGGILILKQTDFSETHPLDEAARMDL